MPWPTSALDFDGAPVQPHQLLDQRQPDARPFMSPRTGALDAVEPLKNVRELLLGDARTGVADDQPRPIRLPCSSDTSISPSSVNLKAFETRFRTIFSHMSRST